MPVLIENVRYLDNDGRFRDSGFVAFGPEGILYCGADREAALSSAEVGADGCTDGAGWEIINGSDSWLMPGMIDAHCHIGLFDDGLVQEGDDGNEDTDPVTPQMRAIDGIFHEDRCFSEAVAGGITSANTGPGSANVLSGRFALVRTSGRFVDEMVINQHSAMKAALGENPKRCHGHGKDRMPTTRMANASVLRDALARAAWYAAARRDKPREHEPDSRWEALLPVLSGELILKFHAHRSDDILTAMRVADEFGLRYTIDHCTEGWLIVDLLKEAYERGQNDPLAGTGRKGRGKLEGIITGPLLTDRSKPELKRAELHNPAVLSAAGLPVAIMTDHPVIPIQYLPVSAALAVRAGMSEELALKAITSVAARLCDAGESRGLIQPGYIADLVLLDSHPFDFRSHVQRVWIEGEAVL